MKVLDAAMRRSVALALLRAKCVKFGEFILASGQPSPYYIDIRQLQSFPDELWIVAEAMMWLSIPKNFDRFVAVPQGATPLASVVAVRSGIGMITARLEQKDHGTRNPFDGDYAEGMRVCILDDVVTSGSSNRRAIDLVTSNGMEVVAIWVVIDRQQGGLKLLREQGYDARAVLAVTELIGVYLEEDEITREQYDIVNHYVRERAA